MWANSENYMFVLAQDTLVTDRNSVQVSATNPMASYFASEEGKAQVRVLNDPYALLQLL